MKLKILATTDIHGNIFPTNYTSRDNIEDFGLARIATAIKSYRNDNKNFLLIDNGDSFQGTPLISYSYEKQITNPIATVFNYLNYDYINLGNHDFNYGEENLINFINDNNAKLLTSNILFKDKPLGSSQIIEVENKKIAIIGVCTHYIPNWEQPTNIKNSTFIDAYQQMEAEVLKVVDQVDFVIGVYHGGLEKDPKTKLATEKLTGENQGFLMCDIKGLDLLITGHQHRSFVETINGVVVTQNTFKGAEFVDIEIDLNSKEISAKIVSAKDFVSDQYILDNFKELQLETQDWLDLPVGKILDQNLLIKDEFAARLNKHPLVSFINQVQLEVSQADISATSLFNGVVGFNQEITMRDLVNTYIYPNTLVVKELSGQALKEAIEVSVAYFDLDKENNIIVEESFVTPKPQHYNYDMFDGVSYIAKISNPVGSRIIDITVNGQPLIKDKLYTLVINNYRAMGAGNYDSIGDAKVIKEIQLEMIDILVNYLKKYSPVKIKHHDNIKIIA